MSYVFNTLGEACGCVCMCMCDCRISRNISVGMFFPLNFFSILFLTSCRKSKNNSSRWAAEQPKPKVHSLYPFHSLSLYFSHACKHNRAPNSRETNKDEAFAACNENMSFCYSVRTIFKVLFFLYSGQGLTVASKSILASFSRKSKSLFFHFLAAKYFLTTYNPFVQSIHIEESTTIKFPQKNSSSFSSLTHMRSLRRTYINIYK